MNVEFVNLGLCTRNNAPTIRSTIESILAQDYPLQSFRLVVVDGLSSDRTVDIVRSMLEACSMNWILLCDDGRGLAFARQLVVTSSTGKYVIWIDGDHVLSPDFISKHVDFMERNPDVGAAEGLMQYTAVNLPSRLEGYSWYVYGLRRFDRDLDSLGSAGAIYRISVITSVGGYDIRIKGAGEDGDISHRIRIAGWKLRMNPEAKFKHVMRTSWGSLWSEYFWWGYGSHFVSHCHKGLVNPYRFLPPLAFLAGIRLGIRAYLMTKDLSCILMPFHYAWKRTAWTWGYLRAHLDGYGQ